MTFLFTDIEGSTRRWEADPEAMRAALVLHDGVLGSVIDGHGGWLFKHTGDGVCAAFSSARGAIDAAGLFTAGATPGGPHTVTASSGAVSSQATVSVTQDLAPTISVAASATSPVTATTSAVSARGADDGPLSELSYQWSATGPAAVTFSPNGSNAAKDAVATFVAAGSYTLTVTVTDAVRSAHWRRVADERRWSWHEHAQGDPVR